MRFKIWFWNVYSDIMRPWWKWRQKRNRIKYLKQVKPISGRITGYWED